MSCAVGYNLPSQQLSLSELQPSGFVSVKEGKSIGACVDVCMQRLKQ